MAFKGAKSLGSQFSKAKRLPRECGAALQSVEEITRLVEEARKPPQGLADWDNDEYLDGALNQEGYAGGSYDEWGEPHPCHALHSMTVQLCTSASACKGDDLKGELICE